MGIPPQLFDPGRPPAEGLGLQHFGKNPLVAIALATTVGVVLDRFLAIPLPFALALGAASLIALLLLVSRPIAPLFLLLAAAALGAAYHHFRQSLPNSEALARLASLEGTPIRIRGRLAAPSMRVSGGDDPLLNFPRSEATKLTIDVNDLVGPAGLEPIRGRIVAYVTGQVTDVYVGDEIETQGRLVMPRGPSNPGEFDSIQDTRDQGIAAILSIPPSPDAVRLVARRWPASLLGWLGRLHASCKATLDERLTWEPGLAAALLLGDGSGMGRAEWDKFLRSGVVHALAISGQHLIVLAGFLELIRRLLFIRLTPATIAITAALFAYALLTGGRAPALRAAWMVIVLGLAVVLKRRGSPENALAVAWLGVLLVNPADLFQTGCQLSFLAVALLHWIVNPWATRRAEAEDPIAELERSHMSAPLRRLHSLGRTLLATYLAGAVIWIGVTPLVAARFHVVAPIALVIGPPVVLATSIALVAGFLLLLSAPIFGPLTAPLAWVTDASLWACEAMIDWGLAIPGASFAVTDLPMVWLLAFYVSLLIPFIWPDRIRQWLTFAVFMLIVGLGLGLGLTRRAEFHVAFLAVGHGGCTVIETSDGRVLVYDAGAMAGPDVTRRIIVPYLWSRGLRRIDELFISHADLDHFNGVPELAERIAIGRVTLTPSFRERNSPGVRHMVTELGRRGLETRVFKAGDGEEIGDIKLDVMHPPLVGPEGKENARSLVMLIRKDRWGLLLTGDLEEAGLERVLSLRAPGIDLLMAPHHGSRAVNSAALAAWAKPRVVVSSQGRPRGIGSPAGAYEAVGATFLTTFHDGAIQVSIEGGEMLVETFRTKGAIRMGPPAVR